MVADTLMQRFGDNQSATRASGEQESLRRRERGGLWTMEPAQMWDLEPSRQRCSLRLANFPDGDIIKGVPIAPLNSPFFAIRVAWPVANPQSEYFAEPPTEGTLMFPRSDSSTTWGDHAIRSPASRNTHQRFGGVFMPGVRVTSDGLLAVDATGTPAEDGASIDVDKDQAFVFRASAFYFLAPGQSRSDAKAVGRDGDSSVSSISATGVVRSG